MYRVILVDDESAILDGLRELVPWQLFGCEVVACECNGFDGVNAVRTHDANILFTDIRMPQMDGIEMITKLRTEHPSLQITVLTAFRDFEYAQRAINAGVTRYLLKPSKMDELYEALTVMTQHLDALKNGPAPEAQEDSPHVDSFLVRNALEYINNHFAERITLLDVANHTYVSQWHLSKLLKKHTDKNFVDILHNVRMDSAKRLLKDPSLRIHEIAEMVGYNDVAHFAKVFKRIVGVSAGEYRNQNL